jgi:hypothetical protein
LASDPITGGGLALAACETLDFSPSLHAQAESMNRSWSAGFEQGVLDGSQIGLAFVSMAE